jgi:hypothetical protein
VILFTNTSGDRTGIGPGGRVWRTFQVVSGWRLVFHDPGDVTDTRAGLHASAEAAMAEASRNTERPKPRL